MTARPIAVGAGNLFKLATMVLRPWTPHMKGAKHTACSTARQRQPPIVQFCAPQTSSVTEYNSGYQ